MNWLILDRCQIDNFVKCLKFILVYRMFYKNKPEVAGNKDFRT